jgi:hypothetical protein
MTPDESTIEGGYVIVARALLFSSLWECSSNTLKVGVYLLLSARYEDDERKGLTRGECLKSHSIIAEDCNISFKASRICLEALKEIGFITCKRHERGARFGQRISIIKYEEFQDSDNYKQALKNKKKVKAKKVTKQPKEPEMFNLEDTPVRPEDVSPKDRITYDRDMMRFTGIIQVDLDRWKVAYPAVVVSTEIAKAAEWVIGAKGKGYKKNWYMFLTNWFSRCQEKGGTRTGMGNASSSTGHVSYADREMADSLARVKKQQSGADYGVK